MSTTEATWGCTSGTPTITQNDGPKTRQWRPVDPGVMESMRLHLESIDVAPIGQTVLMDIEMCPYTLSQMMAFVGIAQRMFPDHEIFMDGDEYAFVARARGVTA